MADMHLTVSKHSNFPKLACFRFSALVHQMATSWETYSYRHQVPVYLELKLATIMARCVSSSLLANNMRCVN